MPGTGPVEQRNSQTFVDVYVYGDVFAGERGLVARCITCGAELHPDRAKKYNYCLAPECQEKNFKGLTMVAVGMNKAADELMILDEETQANLASGKFRDQRRGSFGPAAPTAGGGDTRTPGARTPGAQTPGAQAPDVRTPARRAAVRRAPVRPPWTRSQEKLALLYNSQGLRPADIAQKLGVSSHLVTQIILAAKNRGKS
jgi:hypothetical protein